MSFEWNDDKQAENLKKHGVDFVDAVRIFRDPNRIEDYDAEHSKEEDRWWTIGACDDRTLFVVYTLRSKDTTVRLISARKATKNEAKEYHARRAG